MNKELNKTNTLYTQIAQVIEEARKTIRRAVNTTIVKTYWNIGRLIVEDEQRGKSRAEYGKEVLKKLSLKLSQNFGKGFDTSNLRKMRLFYVTFSNCDALRLNLSWTHYRLLLKVQDKTARSWYMKEAADENWSTRQLERQINSFYYQRILSSTDKAAVKKEAEEHKKRLTPRDILKDPYVLEFLGLKEEAAYNESELEGVLIDKLQTFLLELGKGFSFVARQKRISLEDDHFYIDLVFYNYILKCFILVDIKLGKLTHQDIGQMDTYVRIYEDIYRNEDDNPTIGLILCAEKNDTMVKYSVLAESKHIFASKYQLVLPTEEELVQEIKRERDDIEKYLEM